MLLIDTWYGQETQRPGVIATSERQAPEALEQLTADYGADVVDAALRLRDAASLTPTGPERPYLCHAFCELGSKLLQSELDDVDTWMNEHPRDVVTLFIQDEVTPADTAAAIEQAGLRPYAHTQEIGQPWPTLGEMISSGRRLVVLMENRGGGTEYPWLMQGFDLVQDTPFDATKPSQFSCRSSTVAARTTPIFLVNHWSEQRDEPRSATRSGSTRTTCCGRACTSVRRNAASCPTTLRSTSTIRVICCRSSTGSTASTEATPPGRPAARPPVKGS